MGKTDGLLECREEQKASREGIPVSLKNNYPSIEWKRLYKVFKWNIPDTLWNVSAQHANITWKKLGIATSSRLGYTAGLWRTKHMHLNLDSKPRTHCKTPTLLCTLCDTTQNLERRSQGQTQHLNSASPLQRYYKVNISMGE